MTEYQWKDVSVVGFDELMQALDRADRKGYMPDAIKDEWEAFNWKPAQQEPVEVKQIAEALRQVGLTLVRTGGSFRVMDLGRIEAQATSPPAQRTWVHATEWRGLTDEEILIMSRYDLEYAALIGEVQRKLKEKNA